MLSRFSKAAALPVAAVILAFAAGAGSSSAVAQQSGGAAPEVTVATVQPKPLPLYAELTGRTVAYRVAEVRPQVTGVIRKRLFTEGGEVKTGDQLYQIDAALYEAEVESAEAALAKAKAVLDTTRSTANRYRKLVKSSTVSEQTYDDAIGAFRQAKADVLVAEAALDRARINNAYTKVNAPISGRVGKSHVTEGALVTANQEQSLVTITQLDPIYVDVTQSAGDLMKLRQQLASGTAQRESSTIPVTLTVEGWDTPYGKTGRLEFADVTVDQTTGSVLVRAEFPNPDEILLPGMFVRAKVQQGVIEDAILIPQESLVRQNDGSAAVWLVGEDGTVALQPVTAERAIKASWLISKGLKAGDRVVTAGLQKIQPGMAVRVAEAGADAPPSAAASQ